MEKSSINDLPWKGEDNFVISGISGRYPDSDDIEEFWSNLMNGVQLYTADDRRWPIGELINFTLINIL